MTDRITPAPFYTRLSHHLVSIVIILFLMREGETVLIPLAFAGLLSILLIWPCDFLEKRRVPRGIAALICLLIAIVIVFTILYFVSSQIISFRKDLPVLESQLQIALNNIKNWAQHEFNASPEKIQGILDSISSSSIGGTSAILSSTFSTLSSTLLSAIMVLVYTFLLLLYRGLIVCFFYESFDKAHTPIVQDILSRTRFVIKSYIVGLMTEMVIVAFVNIAGFLLVGARYAVLLGVIAALLNLIPYLGIFTALILSVLITMTTNGAGSVLGVVIVLIIVHLADSNILLPRVVGSKVKINALVSIVGVVVGEIVWGIPGMFLAIPIIAIMKVIFDGVDHLKAWGILLGDDQSTYQPLLKFRKPDPAKKNRSKIRE